MWVFGNFDIFSTDLRTNLSILSRQAFTHFLKVRQTNPLHDWGRVQGLFTQCVKKTSVFVPGIFPKAKVKEKCEIWAVNIA